MRMQNSFYMLCFLVAMHSSVLWQLPTALAQDVGEHPEDILVVANKGVGVKSVSVSELRSIFLKQKKHWGDGKKIVPINAKKGTVLRKAFIKAVLAMDPRKEEAYWAKHKIRTAIEPPPEFDNLLRAVFHLNGSVGYIFRKDFRKGVVKILLVLPRG